MSSIQKVYEAALWYISPGGRKNAQKGLEVSFILVAETEGFIFGPISYEEVDPLSPRVPHPPDNMTGDVMALIGTATVVAQRMEIPEKKFTDELLDRDRAAMRDVTRKIFLKGGTNLTDDECDDIINEYGPEAALEGARRLH